MEVHKQFISIIISLCLMESGISFSSAHGQFLAVPGQTMCDFWLFNHANENVKKNKARIELHQAHGTTDISDIRKRFIEKLNRKEISWKDPHENKEILRRHAFILISDSIKSQWIVPPENEILDSDLEIDIFLREDELEKNPDLLELTYYNLGITAHEGGFGLISGKFYRDDNEEAIFLVTEIQNGNGWKFLTGATKRRYDSRKGASKRPEGNLYSWYGCGIATIETVLAELGIKKIAVLSNTGVKQLLEPSKIHIDNDIINKIYGRPGPDYEPQKVTLTSDGKTFNIHGWIKNLKPSREKALQIDIDSGRFTQFSQ